MSNGLTRAFHCVPGGFCGLGNYMFPFLCLINCFLSFICFWFLSCVFVVCCFDSNRWRGENEQQNQIEFIGLLQLLNISKSFFSITSNSSKASSQVTMAKG